MNSLFASWSSTHGASTSVMCLVMCLMILLSLPYPVRAGYRDAEAAFVRGDYTTAQRHCQSVLDARESTRRDRARASYLEGLMARNGFGMPRDAFAAWLSYSAAASLGSPRGRYGMALMLCETGRDLALPASFRADRLFGEAFPGLLEEARNGELLAQAMVGRMYEKGYGVSRDEGEAFSWYRRAAENGSAAAQVNLGLMLLHGRSTAKDTDAAGRWFRLAAQRNDPRGQLLHGMAILNGWSERISLSRAMTWVQKAADAGLVEAWTVLGYILAGSNPEHDLSRAIAALERAAGEGDGRARLRLASLLETGDPKRARLLYTEEAQAGCVEAQAALGHFLAASGDPENYPEALRWLRTAAEQGSAEARRNLAVMYRNGWGVPRSVVDAWLWGEAAARVDDDPQSTPDSPLQWLLKVK